MTDRRCGDSGITLVEMLIVLVLIGVSASVVTLSLPSAAPPRAVAQEAELLRSRLTLAAEYSLISARTLRLDWRSDGYSVEEWTGDAWQPSGAMDLTAMHRLEDGIVLGDGNGSRRGAVRITPDLLPGSDGIATLRLSSGANQRDVLFDGATARLVP